MEAHAFYLCLLCSLYGTSMEILTSYFNGIISRNLRCVTWKNIPKKKN